MKAINEALLAEIEPTQTIVQLLNTSVLGWACVQALASLAVSLCVPRLVELSTEPANAFRLAAQAVSHSHSALGAFYRRMRSRLGAPKAITATAHKIARLFYTLWSMDGTYTDPGETYYEQKYRERLVKHLQKTAQSLGFDVVPHQSPNPECVS